MEGFIKRETERKVSQVIYGKHDKVRWGREDMLFLKCRKKVSKVILILWLNITSFGCLYQLLYYDLLGTVNYSALKQKPTLLLITQIELMDEYVVIARQAVKKKKKPNYHWPLLITANQDYHNTVMK